MDIATEAEETAPLVPNNDFPTAARNIRRSYEKHLTVHLILASIVFAFSAFYMLDNYLFLTVNHNETLHWTHRNSSVAYYLFEGTHSVLLLIFAGISDAKFGRARIIIIGFPFYLIGFILITVTTNSNVSICNRIKTSATGMNSIFQESCGSIILPALIFTAVGSAAVRSNLIIFGADRIPEPKLTSRYIDKCVVAVTLAAVFQKLVVLCIPNGPDVYFYYYVAATCMLVAAVVLFFISWPYYIHVKAHDSVLTNCIPVTINACRTWRQYKKSQHTNVAFAYSLNTSRNPTDREEGITTEIPPSTILDFARVANNGKFQDRIVDDVKSLRNALLIFVLVIPYRLIYIQLYTIFVSQRSFMNSLPTNDSIDWMIVVEPVTVIIGVLTVNIFLEKYLHVRNLSLTTATKFGTSMCFAIITMCIAAGVELLRYHQCHENQWYSNLTVLGQLPQDIGMGIAQVFSLLASYEFAYFAAPRSAQSLFMSFYLCSLGIASDINDAYTILLERWPIDLTPSLFNCTNKKEEYDWHYPTYFFTLAGLQLMFLIIFLICQKKLRLIKLNQ